MKKLRIFFSLITTVVLLQLSFTTKAQVLSQDSLALVAFYNATNGTAWTDHSNWLTGPVPTWFGVITTGNRVTGLELCTNCYLSPTSNNLSGTFSPAIGNLTELRSLIISGGTMGGHIPDEIGNLVHLQYLYVAANELEGNIPDAIGNLTELKSLVLSINNLEGHIPDVIGNLTKLEKLALNGNQLNGKIPSVIGNLTKLKDLVLSSNDLEGKIPDEIGQLTALYNLSLEQNELEGEIPASIGNLTSLTGFYAHWNHLKGNIPPEIGKLSSLMSLYLYTNELVGPLPPEIGQLTNLRSLAVYDNQLDGEIPAALGNCTNLQLISMYRNAFEGTIPPQLGNLPVLEMLALSDCKLKGTIPSALGQLTALKHLDLSNNQLKGTIPTSLGNLPLLEYFIVSGNELEGGVPAGLAARPLKYVDVANNQLDVMPDLSAVASLTTLDVSHNYFTFEDLEPNRNVPGYTYAPQTTTLPGGNVTRVAGQAFSTSVTIGGTANEYQWWKSGAVLAGQTSSSLNIAAVALTDAGSYSVTITNPLLPLLSFNSDNVVLNVTPAPVGELTVTFNNVVQTPNNTLTWPTVFVGEYADLQLNATNTGNAALLISSVTATGDFTITTITTGSLGAGETKTITIRFTPTISGTRTGTITINSNDASQPAFTLLLQGDGVDEQRSLDVVEEGKPLITGNDLDFPTTVVGETNTKSLVLINKGNTTINVSSVDIDGAFIVTEGPASSIGAGDSTLIVLRFIPEHPGIHTGSLTLHTDSDVPEFSIRLGGEGEADIEVYNIVTTHVNGKHDFLKIRNINFFPGNHVSIFDRWGTQVYAQSDYDNELHAFTGKDARGNTLAEGTYYYVIDKGNGTSAKTGFLQVRN